MVVIKPCQLTGLLVGALKNMTDKLQRVLNAVLRSNNLSLDEAITVAQNRPLWRLMSAFGVTRP